MKKKTLHVDENGMGTMQVGEYILYIDPGRGQLTYNTKDMKKIVTGNWIVRDVWDAAGNNIHRGYRDYDRSEEL